MSPKEIERSLWRQVSSFSIDHITYLQSFDQVKVYYDGGQKIITRILQNAFSAVVSQEGLVWKHPTYSEYRLLQVANYLCDLERAKLRYNQGGRIFGTANAFYGAPAHACLQTL